MGLFLGFLYLKTQSIIPCIIAHSIYNLHAIILLSILPFEIPGYSVPTLIPEVQFQPLWFDLSGIALLLIGYLLLFKSQGWFPKKNCCSVDKIYSDDID